MSKIKYTDKKYLESIVKNSYNYHEAIKSVGLIPGANTEVLKKWIKHHKIDVSHFLKTKKLKPTLTKSTNELLVSNSNIPRVTIKKRIIKENLIPYECKCGNKGEWLGKKMSLILDHINGINNDHRLENLQFVCPNCDAISDTFKRKNRSVA